ncbi:PilX N-terminal domain-containing pilus assembly protein [Pseudomonadota bacterium]
MGHYPKTRQRGTVLLVSLLVLLLLALLGTTVARTSLLQLQMASNDEHRMSALQQAIAVVDNVLDTGAGMELAAPVGYSTCTAQASRYACDANGIALPAGLQPALGRLEVMVERIAPYAARMPRLGEEGASSTVFYRVARFEIRGAFDGSANDLGMAEVTQGVLVRMEH